MAERTYSQINKSVLGSRKFCGLDHKARWAWLCAHLKADYAGIVEYPLTQWALDCELPKDELQTAVQELTSVGLIEWCDGHEVARVTGFVKQRPPENASSAQRLCMDLTDRIYAAEEELEPLLLSASAEFAVASVARSLRWGKDRTKFRDDIGLFLRGIAQDFDTPFMDAIESELANAGRPTRTELDGLLPQLSIRRQRTVSTLSPHPVDTQDEDNTRLRQNEYNYKDETKTLLVLPEFSDQTAEPTAALDLLREEVNSSGISQQRPTESLKNSALVRSMKGCS